MSTDQSFFNYIKSTKSLTKFCEAAKVRYAEAIEEILISNLKDHELLVAIDRADEIIATTFHHLESMELIHPEEEFRDLTSKNMPYFTYIPDYILTFQTLANKDIYNKFTKDIDRSKLKTEEAKYYYDRIILSLKLNGADLNSSDSKELKKLLDKHRKLESKFAKNIAENIPTLSFKEEELKGIPDDLISSNKQPDGTIKLKLVSNNKVAVLTQCEIKETREKVYEATNSYTKPLNKKIVTDFLETSRSIAEICGFKNYAEVVSATKMTGTPQKAREFIEELRVLATPRREKELEAILDLKESLGDNSETTPADRIYYSERLVEKLSGVKESEIRPYFPYKHVREEILKIFSEMFNISFVADSVSKPWHEDIETFLVKSEDRVMGRIHLDMHPRDGKYTHACQAQVRKSIKTSGTPEAILVCNLNKPSDNSDGLQSLDEVETFFHEFGHLLHTMFSSQNNEFYGIGGISVQWDFVETPSQLLEEILKDKKVITRLSKHHKTGQQIPEELIDKIYRQGKLLRASFISGQAAFSAISLNLFTLENVSLKAIEEMEKEVALDYLGLEDKKYFTTYGFGHAIGGYTSSYYTYMWSLAIAKDLFTKFNKKDLLDTEVAEHYRKTILEPGGSKPAAELVKDFLGREWNMEAFKAYLKEGEELLAKI